jgi:broad specificity phosphatase PhoE
VAYGEVPFLSRVYLVRHGQAGTREAYDALSDLGRRQARLLGEYFVSEGIRFAAAYRGELKRQAQTAEEVRLAHGEAGAYFPEVVPHSGWNEFDLDHIYRALAPRMCEEDPEFEKEYREMMAQARASADEPDATVNRRWLPCDRKVALAWMAGTHPYDGESWRAFRERVAGCRGTLEHVDEDANVVVFTSATPVGVWAALTLDIHDDRLMRLAGVLHNASFTVLKVAGEDVRLHSFNGVPHLGSPELRTYR